MPHGGARRGAGRPLGSKSKKPRLLSENITVNSDAVAASDAVLDLMQKIAHDPTMDVQLRLDAARAAAPYLAARIGVRSPDETVSSVAPIKVFQPLAIPSSCFLTAEQIENPDPLIEHAVPLVIEEVAVAESVAAKGPRPAKIHTPTAELGTITCFRRERPVTSVNDFSDRER